MTILTAKAFREDFSDSLSRAAFGKERIAVTRNKKPVAALVPIEDLELLEAMEDSIDAKEADEILAEIEREGTISLAQLKEELGL